MFIATISLETDVMAQLFPNVLTVVTQLIATAILFVLAYYLLWNPVKGILDKRSALEQQKLTDAQALKEKNEELNKLAEEKLSDAQKEAQDTISKAKEEGNRVKNNLVEEGKQKAQQVIDEAQVSIEMQKNKMLETMHEQIVEVAMDAAEKMLQTKLDAESDKAAIEDFVKEVSGK